MLKGVIFDLDGVLCHTDEFHYLAWKEVSDELGLVFDRSLNSKLRGVSRKDSFRIILNENKKTMDEEAIDVILEKKNTIYRKHLATMTSDDLDPDVIPSIERLKGKGLKLAVGSSSKNTNTILENLRIKEYFDAIADGTMIKKSKPDPEVFLLAAEKLELNAEECIVIEDAKAGIEAASRGGMASIAFRIPDMKSAHSLKEVADIIIQHI